MTKARRRICGKDRGHCVICGARHTRGSSFFDTQAYFSKNGARRWVWVCSAQCADAFDALQRLARLAFSGWGE